MTVPTASLDANGNAATTGRGILVWALIVVSSVLIVLATLAVGVQQVLLTTDRWTAAVAPLATNPTVQASVADAAAGLTLNALDLRSRAATLPAPIRGLAGSVEASMATFVNDQALHLVQSPRFPDLWVGLNQSVHPAVVQLLRGQTPPGGAVRLDNGEVQVNVVVLVPALVERVEQIAPDVLAGPLPTGLASGASASQLQQSLASAVGRQIPPDFGYVTVMQASSLATAQRAVQLLDNLTWVLVAGAVVSMVLTIVLAADRFRATLWLGIGVALGMLLAGGALLAVQNTLVAALAGHPISGAAQGAGLAGFGRLGQLLIVGGVVGAGIRGRGFVGGRRQT